MLRDNEAYDSLGYAPVSSRAVQNIRYARLAHDLWRCPILSVSTPFQQETYQDSPHSPIQLINRRLQLGLERLLRPDLGFARDLSCWRGQGALGRSGRRGKWAVCGEGAAGACTSTGFSR